MGFSNRRGQDRTLTNMRQNTMMDEEKSKKMIGRPNMTQYRANNMQDSKANRMDQDTSSRKVNQMRGIDMTTKVVNPALIGQDIYSNPLLTYNILSQPITTNLVTPLLQTVAVPQMVQAPVYTTTPLNPYHVPM